MVLFHCNVDIEITKYKFCKKSLHLKSHHRTNKYSNQALPCCVNVKVQSVTVFMDYYHNTWYMYVL